MEWLINRQRMMVTKSVSPIYLTFEDSEACRICCENWGDYNETVITAGESENTVDIVTTFKSMLNTAVRKSEVISTQTGVDNSGGTYTVGTTKQAVGITAKQCRAVTSNSFNPSSSGGPFTGSSISKFNEFRYFTGVTSLAGNTFYNCTSLSEITLPNTITTAARYIFMNCSSLTRLEIPEGFQTQTGDQWIYGSGIRLLIIPSTVTSINRYTMTNTNSSANACTVICKAANPPSVSRDTIVYSSSIAAVYVPDNSVDTYKETSTWSTIASKIYPISEYVES